MVTEVSLIVGYKVLNIPLASLMDLVSAIQTPPACMAYATREADSDAPDLAYAAVYPFTTIAKIILAQLLTYPFSDKPSQSTDLRWRLY